MERQEKVKKLRNVPPELSFITLDEIAGRLADLFEIETKILNHLQETTPEGVDFPIPEKTVTEAVTINFLKEYPYRKVRSIDFFNKGPNTVYVRVNEEKELPIENREAVTVSKPKATIEHITLRVVADESSTLKMLGHY